MKYYTKIFGTLMQVLPHHYQIENGKVEVFCGVVDNDGNYNLERGLKLGAGLISTRKRGFTPDRRSKQRLGKHFREKLPVAPDDLMVSVNVPDLDTIEKLMGKYKLGIIEETNE